MDAIAIRLGYLNEDGSPNRSKVVKLALEELVGRHPVSDSDLARVRLTGGAAKRDGSSTGSAESNVVPIAEATEGGQIVMTRHALRKAEKAGFRPATPKTKIPSTSWPLKAA